MRLAIHPDGEIVVTAPKFFGLAAIERFVLGHSEWIRKHVERTHGKTFIRLRRGDIPQLKKKALALAVERAEQYARFYGTAFKKIAVRSQKSRWGSCSVSGNLSFNYKLAALPPHIADYIVAHEICHLLQFDHSRRFWEHVERTFPDHKALRAELRNTVIRFL